MTAGERESDQTRVEECVQWVMSRIHGQVFRAGMRLPSIRALARERGVSPFTVTEAYDRLVADGTLEARRGSGFYVRRRNSLGSAAATGRDAPINLGWLLRHMLESNSSSQGPGSGVLPANWLDGARLGESLRALGRQGNSRWLENAAPQGYPPLRFLLQQRLARLNIVAREEQIVLTTGITHAMDLAVRVLVKPGGTVLVLDPCWFGTYGVLASHGANVVGVPLTPQGPDLDALEQLVKDENPQLLIMSSAAHNPTGLSLSAKTLSRILEITAAVDLPVFEDDAYSDLCESPARLASADGLNHVLYAGSFTKTLASNIRVGFIACRGNLAERIADAKILSGFTTPELNERLVHGLLAGNRYDNHVATLREQLARSRTRTLRAIGKAGIEIFGKPDDGLFAWVNMRTDTNELAAKWREKGVLLAPGGLFSPHQTPSHWMRFNVTTPIDRAMKELLLQVGEVSDRFR